jgi:hypothetical protein
VDAIRCVQSGELNAYDPHTEAAEPAGWRANHIEETIRSIARLHAEHHQNATPLQRAVDRITALLGRPRFIGVLTVIAAGWISLNLLSRAWLSPYRSASLLRAGRRDLAGSLMTFRLCRVAKQAPDKRGVVMTKIIAPKCPGPKKGFFDRGLVPCIAFDHAPGGAVALRRVKRFCGLELSL